MADLNVRPLCLIRQSPCGLLAGISTCSLCGMSSNVHFSSEQDLALAVAKAEVNYWKARALQPGVAPTPKKPVRDEIERVYQAALSDYRLKDYVAALPEFKKCAEAGHRESMSLLGKLLFNGLGTDRNLVEAERWYRQAANAGDVSGMLKLGAMYSRGVVVEKDSTEGLNWYRKAAKTRDAEAIFELVKFLQSVGQETLPYPEHHSLFRDAVDVFQSAAQRDDPDAMFFLGKLYGIGDGIRKDHEQELFWIKKAADLQNSDAMHELGSIHAKGKAVVLDEGEALEWFQKSAEKGNPEGMYKLGALYEKSGFFQNYDLARYWYQEAAANGHVDAMYMLGIANLLGSLGHKELKTAAKWMREAADLGHIDAMCYLAQMYEAGDGVSQSGLESVKWFEKAAKHGNVKAMSSLGTRYCEGHGVSKDVREAVKWFERAIDAGDVNTMVLLAGKYQSGDGVEQDYKKATKLFRQAADAGEPNAMAFLGGNYRLGLGVSPNYQEAIRWYQRGVQTENGNPWFGRRMEIEGVEVDYEDALGLFRRAADKGSRSGMYGLGILYEKGLGVAKDVKRATQLYRQAARLDEKQAGDGLANRVRGYLMRMLG